MDINYKLSNKFNSVRHVTACKCFFTTEGVKKDMASHHIFLRGAYLAILGESAPDSY